MEFCRNVSVPGDSQPKLGGFASNSLDELFSIQKPEADVSMEWLSVFVEDCLSSRGNTLQVQALPPPSSASVPSKTPNKPSSTNLSALHKIVVTGKARSKRKRIAAAKAKNNPFFMIPTWPNHSSDPLLLHQSHWLADSELIQPKKQEQEHPKKQEQEQLKTTADMASSPAQCDAEEETVEGKEDQSEESGGGGAGQQGAGRRCTHCLSQRTPQWRAGPMGPKTLCNACGVRYKSGRLLPEYRPAKSPTFVSYLHSNSHKKVMEMRSSNMSPLSPPGERRR
ncbi:GATA transcription factor 12-like [Rhodamnia argentea]|uniref:GATA transcription factor 12-like n=1 Tax=Rhodamnia argentea TaxID=178133 RepID=A0A8B8N3G3_9MYRT|nr:GATA transcription factor 12-like [Rhodamnia argentea]